MSPPPLLERLHGGAILVADGALGTMLFRHGLKPGACPEALNLTQPELLVAIARSYLEAGADLIQTNTFGASPLKLAAYGLEARADEINRVAVEAVRSAAGGRAYVAASIGPSGKILEPYGDADPQVVRLSFQQQVIGLIAAGTDAIVIETMTDLREATLAVEAAKEVAPGIPILATMTFDRTPRGFFTIMGVTIPEAAAGLAAAGADVVGSNCGNGSDNMVEIASAFRAATALPLLMQANAGLPEVRAGELVYGETPEFMAERAAAMLMSGVAILGGCCGTTPAHIRALRALVDARGGRGRGRGISSA